MNTQPEALQLADELIEIHNSYADKGPSSFSDAAAELRRLHEVNQELFDALKGALNHWPVPSSICKDRKPWENARAAIAKAQGENK